MQWVTRDHPKTDRISYPWLIRRFIDPDAEILAAQLARELPVSDAVYAWRLAEGAAGRG